MTRIHRSLIRRSSKVNADEVANLAEDYIDGYRTYKRFLEGVHGFVSVERLQKSIKKIDDYEKEIAKLEDKIDALWDRRNLEAVKLEDDVQNNLDIVKTYLTEEEYKDFS